MINYDEIRESFERTSGEILDRAEELILQFETKTDAQWLDELFRGMHTIKGNAGIFEMETVALLAHAYEDFLTACRQLNGQPVTADAVDVLLKAVDAIRLSILEPDRLPADQAERLAAALRGLGVTAGGNGAASVKTNGHTGDYTNGHAGGLTNDFTNGHINHDNPTNGSAQDYTNGQAMDTQQNQPGANTSAAAGQFSGADHQGATPITKFKLKVPQKLIDGARIDDQYMFAVLFQLARGNTQTLQSFDAALQEGLARETILRTAVINTRWSKEGGETGLLMMIQSSAHPDSVVASIPFNRLYMKILHEPQNQSSGPNGATPESEKVAATPMAHPLPSTNEENQTADIQTPVSRNKDIMTVKAAVLDKLFQLIRETVLARNEHMGKIGRHADADLNRSAGQLGNYISRLQEIILKTRLQSLNLIFARIPRIVRETARVSGKQATVNIEESNIELDKSIIDEIADPIIHLIRNAVDHGIEPADVRLAAGKPEAGNIYVSAVMEDSAVVLTFGDDGAGLDLARIREKAVRNGLVTAEAAATLSDEEVTDFIFEAGFSTAETITETSGRGVGLDSVKTAFQNIGAHLEVISNPGRGTTFRATVPQTLSILTCLIVTLRNQRYAINQKNIKELVSLNPELLSYQNGFRYYRLRKELLPIIDLTELLDEEATSNKEPDEDESRFIVVIRTRLYAYGILVHNILDPEDLVVNNFQHRLARTQGLSGAGVLGDGKVAQVVDVAAVARLAEVPKMSAAAEGNNRKALAQAEEKEQAANSREWILFNIGPYGFALPARSILRLENVRPELLEDTLGGQIYRRKDSISHIYHLIRSSSDIQQLIYLRELGEQVALSCSQLYNIVHKPVQTGSQSSLAGENLLNGYIIENEKSYGVLNTDRLLATVREDIERRGRRMAANEQPVAALQEEIVQLTQEQEALV